jgi:circadian clock protein KaiB
MTSAKKTRPKKMTKKPAAPPPKDPCVLRLFVAGATTRSHQAIRRMRELCETIFKGYGKLEVIDIYQMPALARANQIVATPTLIVQFPPPARRFIGSLANVTDLFSLIDLNDKGKIAL